MNTLITHHTNQTTRQDMLTKSSKMDITSFDGYDFSQICIINEILDNYLDQCEPEFCLQVTAVCEEISTHKSDDLKGKKNDRKPCFQGQSMPRNSMMHEIRPIATTSMSKL